MHGRRPHIAGGFRSRFNRRPAAFTLVELLVVIGIIALLISILLPALSRAREAASRTACEAKLKQIVFAAQLHASDHKGYYPITGVLPGWEPADFDDAYSTKYDYLTSGDPFTKFPAPISFALSLELSHRNVLNNSDNNYLGAEETDSQGLIKNFLCPSQANSVDILIQLPLLNVCYNPADPGNYLAYTEAMSYVFNEAVLGWQDPQTTGRLQGRAASVRQPVLTMFACDGLMGNPFESRLPWNVSPPVGMQTLYDISLNPNIASTPPVTVADALIGDGKAGDSDNFDMKRHLGKINVAFCDGHVETRNITFKDLSTVFLLAP